MIVVHHLENSRSQRILWMLEELDIPYEIQHYKRDVETQLAPESLTKIHPLGKSPVITDNDLVIAESGNIIEYLATRYGEGRFMPDASDSNHWQCKYWLHYGEGSLMPLLVMKLVFDKVKESPMPFFIKPIAKGISDKVMEAYLGPNLDRHLAYVEKHLGDNAWFAGPDLTAADFLMSFPLEAANSRYLKGKRFPNITAYLAKVHGRSGYQAALEKGGPYDYA
ncbi:MAG: glutathione S-transferase [Pseudomonadales bacterium]|nr:glutathione S-transferase [Pseudomonadales bacterium]